MTVDFGLVLPHLRAGRAVRRDTWEEGRRVVFVPARLSVAARPPLSSILKPETWLWTPAHFATLSRFETEGVADTLVRYTVWAPSADDMMADDWQLGEEP